MIRPIAKRLLRRTHRQLNHPGRAQPVLDDRVDGVTVGHVDGRPAVFVAIGFERFDGTNIFEKKLASNRRTWKKRDRKGGRGGLTQQ